MAEAILRNMDSSLEIYSAGLTPAKHVSPIAIEVMKEIGIDLQQHVPKSISDLKLLDVDYLITVSEGTLDDIDLPTIRYRYKFHLGFRSAYKGAKSEDEIRERCREIRDELLIELDYFYRKILKK